MLMVGFLYSFLVSLILAGRAEVVFFAMCPSAHRRPCPCILHGAEDVVAVEEECPMAFVAGESASCWNWKYHGVSFLLFSVTIVHYPACTSFLKFAAPAR